MPRGRLLAAGVPLAVAAGSTWLPWWRADRGTLLLGRDVLEPPAELAGTAVLSGWMIAALVVLAVLGLLLAAARSGAAIPCAVLGGFAALVTGVRGLVDWSAAVPGPWIMLGAGVLAIGTALAAGRAAVPVLVAALVGTLVPGLAAHDPPRFRADAGPFRWVADIAIHDEEWSVGDSALPPPTVLGDVDGEPVVAHEDLIIGIGSDGRPVPLAEVPTTVLAIGAGRVLLRGGSVLAVRPGAGPGAVLDGLMATEPDQVVQADPSGRIAVSTGNTLRAVDLANLPAGGRVAVTEFPVVAADTVRFFPRWSAVAPGGIVRHLADNGSARFPAAGTLRIVGTDGVERVLAGGLDAACGYTSDPARAFLSTASDAAVGLPDVAVDAAGGIWFADGRRDEYRLLRLGPDGVLRIVTAPVPGKPDVLHVAADGALLLTTFARRGQLRALWRLPAAAAATSELPAPGPECGTQRRAPGPLIPTAPVVLPITVNQVVDGRGGTWERRGLTDALVHRTAAGTVEEFPIPDDVEYLSIIGPDLSGAGPIVSDLRSTGRFVDGRYVPLWPDADAGVLGTDGRGWLLIDDRLVPVDADGGLGVPVLDPGAFSGDPTPVDVQLALGVPAAAVSLGSSPDRAALGIDPAGRALIVTADGVVLRATAPTATGPGTVEVLGEADLPPTSEVIFVDPVVGFVADGPVRLLVPG